MTLYVRDLLLSGSLGALVNLPWELAHSMLYQGGAEMTWKEHLICCGLASLQDGIGVAALFGIGAFVFRNSRWTRRFSLLRVGFTVALGLAGAVVTEWVALSLGWWRYGPAMPTVPGTGLGLTPLLQFMVLPVLILFILLPYVWSHEGSLA